jgi:hypothetical protein
MNYKLFSLGCVLTASAFASAAPIVTYSVSGTSGDYTLDFTVDNTMNSPMDLYFFGVLLSERNITGSPSTFNPNLQTSWNNSAYGGSNLTYNNCWIDDSYTDLPAGSSLSGFDVTISDAIAPTSVNWFAYGFGYAGGGGTYSGTDYFNNSSNPGFEGVASATPEPCMMLALGASAFGLILRRRKH